MFVQILLTMFAVGLLLGFVGAGGSGFIISLLTVAFGYSIHTVLGTALLAMMLSSLSGAVSHYREGNINLKAGIVIGCFGGVGAWIGPYVSVGIPDTLLAWLTATMLIVSGLALWLRMHVAARKKSRQTEAEPTEAARAHFWAASVVIGLITGLLSGIFGIGSTPFIQIGLMTLLGMSVRQAAGTTMMIIIPIALSGGMSFYRLGHLDLPLLALVGASMMAGSYIGAKFTKRVAVRYLQAAVVMVPIIGGIIILA